MKGLGRQRKTQLRAVGDSLIIQSLSSRHLQIYAAAWFSKMKA
jgi:hypothetical protein